MMIRIMIQLCNDVYATYDHYVIYDSMTIMIYKIYDL